MASQTDTADWQPSANIEVLVARAALTAQIRQFFVERNVLEVHTPTLGEFTVTDPDVEAIAVPSYGYLQTFVFSDIWLKGHV